MNITGTQRQNKFVVFEGEILKKRLRAPCRDHNTLSGEWRIRENDVSDIIGEMKKRRFRWGGRKDPRHV